MRPGKKTDPEREELERVRSLDDGEIRQWVREGLGLKHPEEFKFETIHRNTAGDVLQVHHWTRWDERLFRGTGRSTMVLVDAMVAAVHGKKVVVRAETEDMEDYQYEKAVQWAWALGLHQAEIMRGREFDKTWHVAQDHPLP